MMKNLPSIEYLTQRGILFDLQTFPESTEKGAANVAKALGFKERQMVKTLVFESEQGEAVLIMVGGDQNAISGNLKKAIGSRNIRMCSFERVKLITGYEVGSIPPFHWQPPAFRSFIDRSLTTESLLGVGSGQWGVEILITPEQLIKASHALVVNLTEK